MKSRHFLLLLFSAATVLVSLALVVRMRTAGDEWPHPSSICAVALAFGLMAPVCIGVVWGRWNLVIRVAVAIGAVFFSSAVAASATGGEVEGWFGVMFVYTAMVAAGFFAVRAIGYQVESRVPSRGRDVTGKAVGRRWQFSLLALLSCTTSVALVLAVTSRIALPSGDVLAIVLFTIACAVLSLVAALFVWQLPPAAAFAGLLVLCPMMGLVFSQTDFPPPAAGPLIATAVVQGAYIAVSVYVMRVAGYWLVKRKSQQRERRNAVSITALT